MARPEVSKGGNALYRSAGQLGDTIRPSIVGCIARRARTDGIRARRGTVGGGSRRGGHGIGDGPIGGEAPGERRRGVHGGYSHGVGVAKVTVRGCGRAGKCGSTRVDGGGEARVRRRCHPVRGRRWTSRTRAMHAVMIGGRQGRSVQRRVLQRVGVSVLTVCAGSGSGCRHARRGRHGAAGSSSGVGGDR